MHTKTLPMFRIAFFYFTSLGLPGIISSMSLPCLAQEKSEQAGISSSIRKDGTETISAAANRTVFFCWRSNRREQVSRESKFAGGSASGLP